MTTSVAELDVPSATSARLLDDALVIELADGRAISAPLAWYPRLLQATKAERDNLRLIGKGHGIH